MTTPKCPKCGNEEKFDIEESEWKIEKGHHVLIEKIRCCTCNTFIKAKYRLTSWKQWKGEKQIGKK